MKSPLSSPNGSIASAEEGVAEPIRILASGSNAFARRLLEAAGDDAIPETPMRRLADALNVASNVPASLPSPSPVSPLVRVDSAVRASRWGGARWAYTASFVGLGAVASYVGWGAHERELREPEVKSVVSATLEPTPMPSPPPLHAEPEESSREAPLPQSPPSAPIAPSKRLGKANRIARDTSPRSTMTAAETSTLTLELRALEGAQRALRAGHSGEAQTALDDYARRFPEPKLAVEAELLRIDVALAHGEREAAIERARALVARPGGAPYRDRLDGLLRELPAPANH